MTSQSSSCASLPAETAAACSTASGPSSAPLGESAFADDAANAVCNGQFAGPDAAAVGAAVAETDTEAGVCDACAVLDDITTVSTFLTVAEAGSSSLGPSTTGAPRRCDRRTRMC